MIKFAHLGLPKTLSSAFQREFFPAHPDLYYLGVGQGGPIDFIDDETNFIFEDLLVYARSGYYEQHREQAIATVRNHLDQARQSGRKAFGVSSEWLGFTLSADMVENQLKARRLAELMGPDTRVILFLRNQAELLRSLYGQYVREGLALSYAEFIAYTDTFKDRNFYFDLCFDHQWSIWQECFGPEQVHFLPIENFRNATGELTTTAGRIDVISAVCEILHLDYPVPFSLPQVNPSLSRRELHQKLELNRQHPHDFGNSIFQHSNLHRSRKYLERESAVGIADYFADIKLKQRSLAVASEKAQSDPSALEYQADDRVLRRLKQAFEAANRRLEQQTGIQLPFCYFDLPF